MVFGNVYENDLNDCIFKYGLVDGCYKVRLPIISSIGVVQRNNISIKWRIPDCEAQVLKYEIQHSVKENDWISIEYKPSKDECQSYAIQCLDYSSVYYVRVRGLNEYGNGPFSDTKTLKTLAQPVPNEPVWSEDYPQLAGNLNIRLQWKVIFDDEEAKENSIDVKDDDSKEDVKRYSDDCEIVQFEIQFADTVSNIWKTVFVDQLVESGNQVCEHRLEKLKETTSYKMRIRCKNRVNVWSIWGPESTLKTLQGMISFLLHFDYILIIIVFHFVFKE